MAEHNTEEDCYIIIGNKNNGGSKVYNVTNYLDDHPGGMEVIMELAGGWADDLFEDIGHSSEARKQLKEFEVADLDATDEQLEALQAKGGGGGADASGLVIGVVVAIVAVGIGYYFMTQSS